MFLLTLEKKTSKKCHWKWIELPLIEFLKIDILNCFTDLYFFKLAIIEWWIIIHLPYIFDASAFIRTIF